MDLKNRLSVALAGVALLWTTAPSAEPIVVQHVEGLVHGFLALRSPEGNVLANGDLIQDARGDRVTSRLVFHFKDGSLNDETAVFSQRGHFRLLSDHLVQKGPAFAQPLPRLTVHGLARGSSAAADRQPIGSLPAFVENVLPASGS